MTTILQVVDIILEFCHLCLLLLPLGTPVWVMSHHVGGEVLEAENFVVTVQD